MQPALYLQELLTQALQTIGLSVVGEVAVQHPTDASHGDYTTTVALSAFTQLANVGQQLQSTPRSPRELAQRIVDELQKRISEHTSSHIKALSVAGPGFINISLSTEFLTDQMTSLLQLQPGKTMPDSLLLDKSYVGRKVMAEFTDPNPFKELHIGHLYSNTVGEAISRLLEALGAEVKRANYQGDVGMHVAKSVWGMRQKLAPDCAAALQDLSAQPLADRVKLLGQAYALGATACEEDEVAKSEIQKINFMTFRAGQETLVEQGAWEPQVDYAALAGQTNLNYQEIKTLYQAGRSWSLEYFKTAYDRVGMHFDDFFFESVVGEFGTKIVREFLAKGVFEESQGAIIFPGSKYGLHDRVFINSLGLPTYEAKELGLAPEKYRRYPYDLSIIITGNEINEYFKVLLKALSLIRPDLAAKTRHLSHGMVRLPEGKMSSRTGKVLTAWWLMDEAHAHALKKLEEVQAQRQTDRVFEIDTQEVAEAVGISAIKYAFLKNGIGKDIAFSFEESLSFQGNSGPYLQYTLVRCLSVLQRAGLRVVSQPTEVGTKKITTQQIDLLLSSKSYSKYEPNVDEIELLRNLYQYSEIVALSGREHAPHHLCTYLYQLAQQFNAFYGRNVVLDIQQDGSKNAAVQSIDTVDALSAQTAFRLILVASVARVIEHALNLLGMRVVERM